MIRGISQSGRYLSVIGGSPSNPYIPSGNQSAGMVRFNTNMNIMEVYDGSTWKDLGSSYSSIGLTPEAELLLDWVRNRMEEEREWENSNHPAVQAAAENLRKARQQVKITAILAKQEENNEETTS